MSKLTTTIYVLRMVDDFGPAFAVACGLQVTNTHPNIVQARMFETAEAAKYFLSLQAVHYQKALKVVEYEMSLTEKGFAR